MSDYAVDAENPPPPASLSQPQTPIQGHGNETPLNNLSADDPNAANNSLIGKVKSRVSSILPNRLSKWFSPSTKSQNDSLNGSINIASNTGLRKRHIEVDDDEGDEEEDDERYTGITTQKRRNLETTKAGEVFAAEDEDDEDDDQSQNSEDEYNATLAAQRARQQSHRTQPPSKRSRYNSMRVLIEPRQPLISSTPTVASGYMRTQAPRQSYQRLTNLNLYGHQSKKEPAYDFSQQNANASPVISSEIIDLISKSPNTSSSPGQLLNQSAAYSNTVISSRRSLNIAPTLSTHRLAAERSSENVGLLKRHLASSTTSDSSQTAGVAPPRRTSTTIHEVTTFEEQHESGGADALWQHNISKYNGQTNDDTPSTFATNKRQKHINGSGLDNHQNSDDIEIADSTSESNDSVNANEHQTIGHNLEKSGHKIGIFNTKTSAAGSAAGTTRNSSRTSSFGNGLNFYSHLEGRKSLFGGTRGGTANSLNNSTLSLNSLNRRQFNASIYGSTSALSDSRLLNTFSPFYKGKTTYGGAAAYNKYSAGAGANAVRITPTLIRPASSLSTLSSSNASLAPGSGNLQNNIGESSSISSTAKRILDLINDFATPLSDAKKMANNLKATSAQSKSRLNESDLNASRAMRLSQVRTPYARPAVILQPNNAIGGVQPPVKELQVPTMSQLLQMKKIQKTTERARTITKTTSNTVSSEYVLPVPDTLRKSTVGQIDTDEGDSKMQQKHTNKIKNKLSTVTRATTKHLEDETVPPVNLHNIAFPLMQSVPKFDISFSVPTSTTPTVAATKQPLPTTPPTAVANSSVLRREPISSFTVIPTSGGENVAPNNAIEKVNYKFSEPLVVNGSCTSSCNFTSSVLTNFKFSPPLEVSQYKFESNKVPQTQTKQSQLKTTGSCLDVLSNSSDKPIQSTITPTLTSSSFGNQFKITTNQWECDVCMIRNNSSDIKCVACETPRQKQTPQQQNCGAESATLKGNSQEASNSILPTVASTFGDAFKKSSAEWECDVCMLRNKNDSPKCVACEAPRKGAMPSAAVTNAAATTSIKNTFGDAFKPKSGTWECPECMINNKSEATKCVACETKKPGSVDVTVGDSKSSNPKFQFGFPTPQTAPPTTADSGFKSLAAEQRVSKWECEACMTRNDSERTKCACCGEPKPGCISESSSTSTSKFTFGSTATAKFSFGFGTQSNAASEEELRKVNTIKPAENNSQAQFSFGLPSAAATALSTNALPASTNTFGLKTDVPSSTQETKSDEPDAKKLEKPAPAANLGGFKFGFADSSSKPSNENASAASGTSSVPIFGSSTSDTSNSLGKTSEPATNSVKFNLPVTSPPSSTTSGEKSATTVPFKFGFGSTAASTDKTEGGLTVSSGSKPITATVTIGDKSEIAGFAFKTPANVSSTSSTTSSNATVVATRPTQSLMFGAPAAKGSSFSSSVLSGDNSAVTNTTTSSVTTTTNTATVKPMFSFGSTAVSNATEQSKSTFGGFAFGATGTSSTSSDKPTFGTANTTSGTTPTTNSTPSVAPTSGIFGSFGQNASATSSFGSAPSLAHANPANNATLVSSSTNKGVSNETPTFGSMGNSATATNVFGSFGGTPNKLTTPTFGSTNASSSVSNNKTTNAFVFGSSSAAASTAATSVSATPTVNATESRSATTTSWPKNSFVFGTVPATSSATASGSEATGASKDAPKPSVFGTFGGTSSNTSQQTSSIFGSPAGPTGSASATPVFGSAAGTMAAPASANSSNLFTANAAPAANTNFFGASSSGNAATPAPAFGSSPFGGGGTASATSATPTFGSTAISGSATFGSFSAAPNVASNTTEIKKPTPAFSFGSAPTQTQATSGGFNFGSSLGAPAAKPAFNFGGTTATQPTFNFTGSAEPQTSTKPFQFGAIPPPSAAPPPVFNFGGGTIEATPNAPFQFNAGSAPVSSNIFAPSPTPGTQSAQQAKRKIRAPLRRVTQR